MGDHEFDRTVKQLPGKYGLTRQSGIKKISILIPVFGAIIFIILYIIATFYYPGGSQFDKNSIGFSWADNYWCNLLNENAINGQSNSAKPIALAAMLILCLTLTYFWWQFPKYTSFNNIFRLTIQMSGALAMGIGFLLFTGFNHDLITNLASLFGLIATTGTFFGLYKNGWITLFCFGLFNILLVILNNFLYYEKDYISYLPIVQKITFASFLLWICCINMKIFNSFKNQLSP